MRYKTLQFVKQWNQLAKPEYRIRCTKKELYNQLQQRYFESERRYVELPAAIAKDGTTHEVEF